MFGRGKNAAEFSEVARLAQENVLLKQHNERLERLSATGNAAALAGTIIDTVDKWVETGLDPTNPAGYDGSLDPAISAGILAATKEQAEAEQPYWKR